MQKLTGEQQRIVASQSKIVVVNAFAGTGKTSTLTAYANARSDKSILYLAFNKAVADEGKKKMPSNVKCITSHALAYAAIGKSYPAQKLSGRFNSWTLSQNWTIKAPSSKIQRMDMSEKLTLAQWVVQKIQNFTQSGDDQIKVDAQDLETQFDITTLEDALTSTWKRIINKDDELPMTHDVYFKLWQLSQPKLNGFDVILLDEAQDTNPALWDVFSKQENKTRVLVGDRHQNIYGFRGSMNAMNEVKGDFDDLSLTQSFRFGVAVADVANTILRTYKNERRPIKGLEQIESLIGGIPDKDANKALLFRTNAGLFDAAATMCGKGAKVGLLGRFADYAFSDIEDTYWLSVGRKSSIKNPYLKSFDSFNTLTTFAQTTDDKELKVRLGVIKKYGSTIPGVSQIIERSIDEKSSLCLTTAHKSKGQEWDQVLLGEDFQALMSKSGTPLTYSLCRNSGNNERALPQGEANLYYVAVTRAKRRLIVNSEIQRLLQWEKENICYHQI